MCKNGLGQRYCLTMILARLVLLTLCLAACARQAAPPPEVWPSAPLARAAYEEWVAWGRIVIEGWPDTPPSDTAATPERFNRLLGYWNVVPGGWRIAQRHAGLRSGMAALEQRIAAEMPEEEGAPGPRAYPVAGLNDIAFYEYPAWSAVFISTIARRASLPESELPSSSRHASYIDGALMRAMTEPESAAFRPYAPEEYTPAPGDLLCADRAWVPLTHWSQRLAERGRPRPMHCDVVVRNGRGVVEAIGGNVQGVVALRRFPADAQGRVLPAPFGRPPFVLVLAAQNQPR